jgi:hypothetical protein
MTAAPAQLAGERGDVRLVHQSMYYPVTDDAMDTGSYKQFAESGRFRVHLGAERPHHAPRRSRPLPQLLALEPLDESRVDLLGGY